MNLGTGVRTGSRKKRMLVILGILDDCIFLVSKENVGGVGERVGGGRCWGRGWWWGRGDHVWWQRGEMGCERVEIDCVQRVDG